MTIGVKPLTECVNAAIDTACDQLTILQLSSVSKDFDAGFVSSVANTAALPSAACNRGRMIYVQDVCGYRYSDGVSWTNNFESEYDGGAWSWGSNSSGRLGDGTTATCHSSPVSVVGGFTDWCQVSAGNQHSLAIRTNGTAWAWGCNGFGKLGDLTATDRSSPVSVVGGFSDWCQVSAGSNHSLGVRSNGTAWSWGINNLGQLGDDTATCHSSPVSVVGGFTDWCQVSAGSGFSLGVRCNGTAWAWGCNLRGTLGDATLTDRSSPVSVVGGFTNWCYISAGDNHSLGVRSSGTAWAWGCGFCGRLGNNNTTNRSSPVLVVGGFTDWCQVSAGSGFSLAVRTNGTAWAWGLNSFGRLGDDTSTDRSSPVSVVGGFTDWCQISGGCAHGLAVRTNGTAWAWGCNNNGQLGDGSVISRSSPVSVVGGFTDWCQISAGSSHNLALRSGRGF